MKITIETGGTVHMCGGEKCTFYGVFWGKAMCTYFLANGKTRKLRLKKGQPLRCKPCLESLVFENE